MKIYNNYLELLGELQKECLVFVEVENAPQKSSPTRLVCLLTRNGLIPSDPNCYESLKQDWSRQYNGTVKLLAILDENYKPLQENPKKLNYQQLLGKMEEGNFYSVKVESNPYGEGKEATIFGIKHYGDLNTMDSENSDINGITYSFYKEWKNNYRGSFEIVEDTEDDTGSKDNQEHFLEGDSVLIKGKKKQYKIKEIQKNKAVLTFNKELAKIENLENLIKVKQEFTIEEAKEIIAKAKDLNIQNIIIK